MHTGSALPLARENEKMKKSLITMTKKVLVVLELLIIKKN